MIITDWRSRVPIPRTTQSQLETHHAVLSMPGVPFYSILLQILITAMTDSLNIGFRVSMGGALVAAADVVICNKIEQFTEVI